ncbi:MAG: GYD domain-containing protein [Candidatus Krumholzibacteriia bacterium]
MPIFVLMTKLTPSEINDAADRRRRGEAFMQQVHAKAPGVKWLAHYALLGRYDFMDIYEAPDETAALKVSLISRRQGAATAESWLATPYEHHLKLLEELDR